MLAEKHASYVLLSNNNLCIVFLRHPDAGELTKLTDTSERPSHLSLKTVLRHLSD